MRLRTWLGGDIKNELGAEIRSYYERRSEETRLERGLGRLESSRTRQLIERFMPPGALVVLDVGGAAGHYALWLADLGHEVHLVEPVPRLLEVAAERSGRATRPLASVVAGDARDVPSEDESADVLLLLGPLYHLQDEKDRGRVLSEATRVLRPGGVLFAAGLSRFGGVLDGVVLGSFADDSHGELLDASLKAGLYGTPGCDLGRFTTAYFHLPDQLRGEVESAGFEVLGLEGVEGPARMLVDFDAAWSDSSQRELLTRLADRLGPEPSLLGMSPHLLVIAKKPSWTGNV